MSDQHTRRAAPPAHARYLARALDTAFRVPGTQFRFGLDPLLGLIPVVGDLLGGAFAAYILVIGARAGAPKSVLLRMLANIGIDAAVGAIPLLGDLFDAHWKANTRNLALVEEYLARPRRTRRASTGFLVLLILGVIVIVAGAILLLALLIAALVRAFT